MRSGKGISARPRGAFTLVELLVVVAVIGVLIALLLPAVQSARESARRTGCVSNLKQVTHAMQMHDDTIGRLPYAIRADTSSSVNGSLLSSSSAFVDILPYIGRQAMHDQYDFSQPPFDQTFSNDINQPPVANECVSGNCVVAETIIPEFVCPSTVFPPMSLAGIGTYGVSIGKRVTLTGLHLPPADQLINRHNGVIIAEAIGIDVSIARVNGFDGASNTFIVGEMSSALFVGGPVGTEGAGNRWASGYPIGTHGTTDGVFNPGQFTKFDTDAAQEIQSGEFEEYQSWRSDHPGGVNMATVDGAVRFFATDTDEEVLDAYATRRFGEIISGDIAQR